MAAAATCPALDRPYAPVTWTTRVTPGTRRTCAVPDLHVGTRLKSIQVHGRDSRHVTTQ